MKMPAMIKTGLMAFAALMVLQLSWLLSRWLEGAVFGLPYILWLAAIFVIWVGVGIFALIFRNKILPHDQAAA
ncbi:MAG: hypothetical protein ACK4SS_03340, partial [Cypionkella sp.]